MPRKKKETVDQSSNSWPHVTKGSHLTVITHENGKTELHWDDEALIRDVKAAILKAESAIPAVKSKSKKSKAI